MIRFATILLIFTFGLQVFPSLLQFKKLPILFAHFQEHKALEEHLSFTEYLFAHYLDNDHKDDYSRDEQLPFKQMIHQVTPCFVAIVAEAYKFSIVEYLDTNTLHFPNINDNIISYYHHPIFQPPRFI